MQTNKEENIKGMSKTAKEAFENTVWSIDEAQAIILLCDEGELDVLKGDDKEKITELIREKWFKIFKEGVMRPLSSPPPPLHKGEFPPKYYDAPKQEKRTAETKISLKPPSFKWNFEDLKKSGSKKNK